MLETKYKLLMSLPEGTPLAEPIRLPRRGRPWKVADLQALAGDENSFELVRGDLLMMAPASPVQGRFASRLNAALLVFVEEHDLGEVYTAEPGFLLQPDPEPTVRAPDVAFLRKDRIPPANEQEGFWPLAPDLVVEIISPTETAEMIQEKVQDYLNAGTQLIWLVYPKLKTVIEYRLAGEIRQMNVEDSLDGGETLPGFHYPLMDLFRG